ncbi:MAG: aminopeptidase [Solirubrobacterales bacterium]|nr:aminopeptidase [Solirubrobacterales bacterium]
MDPARHAALLCDWCLEVQQGQEVLVDTTTAAEPLAVALEAALLERGAWPHFDLALPGHEPRVLKHGREPHFDGVSRISRAVAETMDAHLHVRAPQNMRELAGADPALLARRARAISPLREIRLAKRWALSIWPTDAQAQEAGMSLAEYAAFLERALFLDQEDPLAAWRSLRERQSQLLERLGSARRVRIESERTDITLAVDGRTWQNSDGRRNMPSGEVFTSPHETSANGTVYFDVPSKDKGVEVAGISLSFIDGAVVEAHAERGEAQLKAQLDADPGARRLGEIGIGTNYGIDRATGSTLLDEKIGGTVHLALGRSYPECGGVNESAIHWDLICDLRGGGRISVDGEVLSEDGRFS